MHWIRKFDLSVQFGALPKIHITSYQWPNHNTLPPTVGHQWSTRCAIWEAKKQSYTMQSSVAEWLRQWVNLCVKATSE